MIEWNGFCYLKGKQYHVNGKSVFLFFTNRIDENKMKTDTLSMSVGFLFLWSSLHHNFWIELLSAEYLHWIHMYFTSNCCYFRLWSRNGFIIINNHDHRHIVPCRQNADSLFGNSVFIKSLELRVKVLISLPPTLPSPHESSPIYFVWF